MAVIIILALIRSVFTTIMDDVSVAPTSPSESQTETQAGRAANEPEPTSVPVEEVDAKTFVEAFDKNQLRAEEQYKDKRIRMTAFIANISEDLMGTPFLSLKPSNESYYFGTTAQCLFKDKAQLTSVENDQQVTIEGTVTTQSLGIIGIKDCTIVE